MPETSISGQLTLGESLGLARVTDRLGVLVGQHPDLLASHRHVLLALVVEALRAGAQDGSVPRERSAVAYLTATCGLSDRTAYGALAALERFRLIERPVVSGAPVVKLVRIPWVAEADGGAA